MTSESRTAFTTWLWSIWWGKRWRLETDPSFTPETPEVLFEGDYFAGAGRSYDVAPDGQRFLMIKAGDPSDESSSAPELIIVENWFEELKRLVPTN